MTTSDQYRRYLSQGMTPTEAENYVAEEQEWERIEREAAQKEADRMMADPQYIKEKK